MEPLTHTTESVATVLERALKPLIERWMQWLEKVPTLTRIPLTHKDRTGHLPQLMEDLIVRLRLEKGVKCPETTSAHDHGQVRFDQGYSAPKCDTQLKHSMEIFTELGVRRTARPCGLGMQSQKAETIIG